MESLSDLYCVLTSRGSFPTGIPSDSDHETKLAGFLLLFQSKFNLELCVSLLFLAS